MKKLLCLALSLLLVLSVFAGCTAAPAPAAPAPAESKPAEPAPAPAPDPAKKVKLTFMTNVVGEQAAALEEAIKAFSAETGYEVEFSAPGKSYEELMKTKMSSQELPDLFTTHGWAVARYGEYLLPINDQPFTKDISAQIKPIITNKDGNVLVLPVDQGIAGILYNEEVLKAAGVEVDTLTDWTKFEAACDKIKAAGKEPMTIGGKDVWTIGQFFDWVAPSFYITDDANNKREEMKSGKFDTELWKQVAGLMDKWTKAGYFNQDVLTADYNGDMEALAKGEAAFAFYGNGSVADIKKVNPEAKIGMMPIPAAFEGDKPSLIAGENITVGVWKDTPNKEASIELLNYFARPDVMAKIATAAGNPAGLTTATSDTGELKAYYDKHSAVETFAYFDREFLPSGMWDVMCATGADVLAGKATAVEDAAKVMEQNFNDKFAQG